MMRLSAVFVAIACCAPAFSWGFSPSCALGLKMCVKIQGVTMTFDDAERITNECRDFTRGNIGARVLRMSTNDILNAVKGSHNHPLIRASVAYDYLHESSLKFDRSLPIEKRYFPVRRACGEAFRDFGVPWPEDD